MKRRQIACALAVLSVGACKNLDTVQSLSGKLVSATNTFDDVSGEFAASCARQQQFNPQLGCDGPNLTTKGLVSTDKLLADYFSALGEAAGAKSFTVKDGLDTLTQSVSAIPGIDTAKVQAASGLAETIATLFTEGARERTLLQ